MNVATGRLLPPRSRRRTPAPASTLPWYGLATFTFFFVTQRFPELFTEVGIYLALLGLVLRPEGLILPPPLRWALAFLLWASITALFAIVPDAAWPALLERLKALVIFFVVVNTLRTPQQLRVCILIILFAFLIYPVRGTLQGYVSGNTVFGRAIWNKMYSNPNELAGITLLMLGLALAVASVKAQNRRVRLATTAFVPVLLLMILLTQSRGAFLGLLVGFGPPLLTRVRRQPSGAAAVLMALVVVAMLVPAASWDRLKSMTQLGAAPSSTAVQGPPSATRGQPSFYVQVAEASTQQRIEILKTGWHIFLNNPILGVGIGCYNDANARLAPWLGLRDAHNTYLSLAAETGLPGLLLWLGLLGSVLAQVKRRCAPLQVADCPIQILWIKRGIIGYFAAGFFATFSGLTMAYLFLGVLLAAANVLGSDAPGPGRRRYNTAPAGTLRHGRGLKTSVNCTNATGRDSAAGLARPHRVRFPA